MRQKEALNKLSNGHNTPQKLALRSNIVLMAAKGYTQVSISKLLRIGENTTSRWIARWMAGRESDIAVSEILNDEPRSGAPGTFRPEQLCQLFAMACEKPAVYGRPISHWTPRELADELKKQGIVECISPRQVGRLLDEADIKPHLMRYYLYTEKDEKFDEKVADICEIYQVAPSITAEGGRVISCDEMCGIQALERIAPDKLVEPGRVERHEFNYERHGTLIANFDVGTGKVLHPSLGPTRTESDFVIHLDKLVSESPSVTKWHFILDNLNIHQSESLVIFVANHIGIDINSLGKKGKFGILKTQKSRQDFLTNPNHAIVFHYTPKHASWMNQVEIWFSILARKLLKRESFSSIENLGTKIIDFIKYFNKTMAKPFKWTYKGRVLSA
jgi:transposase